MCCLMVVWSGAPMGVSPSWLPCPRACCAPDARPRGSVAALRCFVSSLFALLRHRVIRSLPALTCPCPPISLRPMSGLPFELLLALRYLRPKRTFVSVITLISVLGVTLGVAVLIIVISVMSGFDRQLRDKILGFNPHLRITEDGRSMKDHPRIMKEVSANKNVKGVA